MARMAAFWVLVVYRMKKEGMYGIKILLIRVLDVLCVSGSFVLLFALYGDWWSEVHGYASLLSGCIFLLCGNALGIYASEDHNRKRSNINSILTCWFATLSCLLLFAYATKTSVIFSRLAIGIWILFVPVILWLIRKTLDDFFKKMLLSAARQPIAIAGCGDNAYRFVKNIEDFPELGIKVAGIYLSASDRKCVIPGITEEVIKGDLALLVQDAKAGMYSGIYIALSMRDEVEINALIGELGDCSVPVYFIPDILTANLMSSHIYNMKGMPIVSIYDTSMDAMDVFVKRVEDLVLTIFILLLSAVPMLLIAVFIKATSPGPVFFRQKRYGLGGEPIEVWKFRSMTVCENGSVIVQAKKDDVRITRLGAFLRKTSLDELPQFFNVLVGDMSIVGPRPHAVSHNELYRKYIHGYMLRHLVKPGITGWAQVNGWRGETDTLDKMEMRIQYDLEYIKNWSVWFDLRIIAMTIAGGFSGKNAY